ncbi:hypothetical protein AALP_AA3G354700, partial [Arabis alpina]
MDLIQLLLSALSLFSIFFFLAKSVLFRTENKKRMAPMAPGSWPLVGHLPFFENSKPTHVTFGDMAEVLGPVFMTKLGSYNVLIISSQEVAKECFTVHDKVIDRVDLTASKLLGYNGSFITFTPYGPYWQELRKIASSELFSTTTIDKLKDTRAREVDVTFKDFYLRWEQHGGAKKGVLVDMKREFQDLAANIALMMIAGKRYFGESPNCEAGEARRCGKLIQEFFDYFGIYMLSDVIPSLGWSEWKIKRGSEPVIVVCVWAISLLVNNPHVLRKAQEELDRKIGRDKVVEESDLKDLVYLHAIVKETFRLYPPLPLVAYRYVMEDFDIANGNFHVPA